MQFLFQIDSVDNFLDVPGGAKQRYSSSRQDSFSSCGSFLMPSSVYEGTSMASEFDLTSVANESNAASVAAAHGVGPGGGTLGENLNSPGRLKKASVDTTAGFDDIALDVPPPSMAVSMASNSAASQNNSSNTLQQVKKRG